MTPKDTWLAIAVIVLACLGLASLLRFLDAVLHGWLGKRE